MKKYKNYSFNLPTELHYEFKKKAVIEEKNLSQVVAELIAEWLKKKPVRPKQ